MKKWITCFLAVLMSLSSVSVLYAKEAKRFNGKVTQLNIEAKTFVLTTEKESWKVLWDENTNFVFEGKKAQPTDLKEDLHVLVAGKPAEEEKTLQALVIAWGNNPDRKDPPGPGRDRDIPNIFGKMTQLNLTDKTFRLELTDKEGNPIVFQVTYHEKTTFIRDRKQAKPEDFKDGEEVTVAGRVNPEEKTILAMAVALGRMKLPPGDDNERPPMVFGKMTGLNVAEKTFNLELKGKDGNPIIFAVSYFEETKFIRNNEEAKPEDFKDGEEVTVAGRINREDKKILAMAVILGKVELPPNNPGDRGPDSPPGAPYKGKGVQGKVVEINYEKMQFTLQARGEILITIQYHDWTDFVKNGNFVFPKALMKEDKVIVYGPLDPEQKTIDAHYVVW